MKVNVIQACDFYKVGHKFQYPEGTQYVFSNFTARSDRLATKTGQKSDGKVLFFGLQGFIKEFLIDAFNENFFWRPKQEVVAEYTKRMNTALVTDDFDASHIAALHDLGYLPLCIRALPEGSLVPVKVPVLTIVNTHPDFFWLTNYVETLLSAELWKKTTSATTAYKYREILQNYAVNTGSPLDFVLWQGHDFSFRGLSGYHDAAGSGAGHLLSFLGTDTIPAMEYLETYYSGDQTFVGGSVPATEHSVMSMGGKETEIETYRRLITQVYPSGVVSIVSDTWDFWKVISEYTVELKQEILNRKPNAIGLAKVVFRPDSGDPADILCGVEIENVDHVWVKNEDALANYIRDYFQGTNTVEYNESEDLVGYFRWNGKLYKATASAWWNSYENFVEIDGVEYREHELTVKEKGAVEVLWEIFGGTETEKGCKLLDSHVGLIYGDSITLERAQDILRRLEAKGFASGNVVFGIGSFTYQYVTRDKYGFAVKSTFGVINGEPLEIYKDPVTDSGVKKSAKGLLDVVLGESGEFILIDQMTPEQYQNSKSAMKPVFLDGNLSNETTLEEIRNRIAENLTK